jgi:hypothetical protein
MKIILPVALCALPLLCATAFSQQPQQLPASVEAPAGVTLKLEAGIVYKLGGPQPVARATFYLLDRFPAQELAELPAAKVEAAHEYLFSCGQRPDTARQVIGKHVVYQLTTGFDGKAELANIKPGRYVLLGGSPTRGGCAFWTLEVDLSKDQAVVLDQSNAAYVK